MSYPSQQDVASVLDILHAAYPNHPMHQAFGDDPFRMLVAVILSQRATDAMTIPVAKKLFEVAGNPAEMLLMSDKKLESLIHSIGFYHQKTKALKKLSRVLIEQYKGQVPSTEQELLSLPQVGRKTANIMLTLFFCTPQIAVDVHVHRIAHRLGWIKTSTPEKTELALTKFVPPSYVPIVNQVFVRHGQEVCRPLSPHCNTCPIETYCKKIDVLYHR